MTMRSYDDIEWRAWYIPDTARWLKLSLGARGLTAELLRKLDRHGRIALGDDPAADLAVILRLDEDETRAALTELLVAGRLVWDTTARVLSDPDLPARMRMGSAARMAKKRERDAAKAEPAPASQASQPVTTSHDTHGPSPSDLSLISSGSDLDLPRSEEPTGNRAREVVVEPILPDTAPAWWPAACDTAGASIGAPVDERPARWLEYSSARHRKGWAANQQDAAGWLVAVVRRERRDAAANPRSRGSGGGPRGDRQGLGNWRPPASTGTDDPFGGES